MEEDALLKRCIENNAEEISIETVLKGINLHYFFDTLHVIKGYIITDEKNAMDAINLLAKTIRKGVQILKEGRAYGRIREELEYIRLYLELAQMHYGRIEYMIWNNSEDFLIPLFTVRHMTEEAFARCLTAKPEFRKLRIYTFSDNTHDYIEIKDSGKMLLEEEIKQMMEESREGQENGYLLFKKLGWRIEIEGLPGEGNRVFLSCPRKEAGDGRIKSKDAGKEEYT